MYMAQKNPNDNLLMDKQNMTYLIHQNSLSAKKQVMMLYMPLRPGS